MTKKIGFLLISALCAMSSFAQGTVAAEIKNIVDALHDRKYANLPREMYTPKNSEAILSESEKYMFDSVEAVRKAMCIHFYETGMRSSNADIRIKAVELLSVACVDKSAKVAMPAAQYLQSFSKNDFSPKAVVSIKSAYVQNNYNKEDIILLLGFLQVKEYESRLQNSAMGDPSEKNKWAAQRALARMGNRQAISFCSSVLAQRKIDDRVVFHIVPDLLYTCQMECYKPIVEILYSNEKNCVSAQPDNEYEMLCGYRIMAMLAPYIKDYPLQLKLSGDVDTDSYEKALQEVRDWFTKKGDGYVIRTDVF